MTRPVDPGFSGDLSPTEIALRAAKGDPEAFAWLHRRYDVGLRRFLGKRTGANRDRTEELAQQTWAEVWRAMRACRYDPERGAVSTFIYAVAYKRLLQDRRESATRPGVTTDTDEFFKTLIDHTHVEGEAYAAELLDAFRGCLANRQPPNNLAEDERRLLLALAEGRTERDLARDLGIAPSTVHAWKHNAYDKLRRCLKAKGFSADDVEHVGSEPE